MNRSKAMVVILVLALLGGGLVFAQNTAAPAKVQWEYTVYPSSGNLPYTINEGNTSKAVSDFVTEMNKLGADGWEIIEVGGSSVVLKRMKQASSN